MHNVLFKFFMSLVFNGDGTKESDKNKMNMAEPVYFPFPIQGLIKLSRFMGLGVEGGYTNRCYRKTLREVCCPLHLSLPLWQSVMLELLLFWSTCSVKSAKLKTSR